MKTRGIFQCLIKDINIPNTKKEIVLAVFGDLHYNSRQCDKQKFEEFLKEAKDKNAYLIGLGDYLDSVSSSERAILSGNKLHDSTINTIEKMYLGHTKELATLINKYCKGKVLGLVEGNHYYQFVGGATTDELLCQYTGAGNMGTCCILRLSIGLGATRKHSIDIACHHGLGGGRSCGSSINKLQQMSMGFDADIMLQGHDHNRCVDYINRLQLNHVGRLINKKVLLARTGSFLKGFEEGVQSYVVDALYPPSDLGGLFIKIKLSYEKPDEKQESNNTITHDISVVI